MVARMCNVISSDWTIPPGHVPGVLIRGKMEPNRIFIERGQSGVYVASSPDVPGLLVAKMNLGDCCKDIPRALRELSALSARVAKR